MTRVCVERALNNECLPAALRTARASWGSNKIVRRATVLRGYRASQRGEQSTGDLSLGRDGGSGWRVGMATATSCGLLRAILHRPELDEN